MANPFHNAEWVIRTASNPDNVENPHVARCTGCGRRYNVREYDHCIQDGGLTLCSLPHCRGEVLFL